MLAVLLGMIGIAFALNGLMMVPSVESALHQQVVAIYLVGGAVVFGLAILIAKAATVVDQMAAWAKASMVDGATAKPKAAPTPVRQDTKAVDASSHMTICPNCGRENPPNASLCSCGMSLRR